MHPLQGKVSLFVEHDLMISKLQMNLSQQQHEAKSMEKLVLQFLFICISVKNFERLLIVSMYSNIGTNRNDK